MLRNVLPVLFCAGLCLTALTAQTDKKGTLEGTITESNVMIPFSPDPGPVRFEGITFKLQEYPNQSFVFRSGTFDHEGKNIVKDRLKGLRVRLTYEKGPDDRSHRVTSLKWLPAAKAETKK